MERAETTLPKWKCHKEVQAGKITGIAPNDEAGWTPLLLGDIDAEIRVSPEWREKHKPEVGGYYVVYADGYSSYSPGKAFEEGYTLI